MKRPIIYASIFLLTALIVFAWIYFPSQNIDSKLEPAKPETNLYLGWIYSGSYAGDALASTTFAAQNNLTIRVHEGGQGLDPLKLVGDGSFGIASSDDVLRAADKGMDVVIVGVATDSSPVAFLALESSGISKPEDFKGKRVGMLPFGSTQWIYRSLLVHNKINRDSITEVPIGPDLKTFLVSATHDVHPAYVYDETVDLDKQGIKYRIIRPGEWGVHFKGPVYFTTRRTVETNPGLVTAFVRSTIAGWRAAYADPQAAIAALGQLSPTLNKERELEVLKRGLPLFVDPSRPILSSDTETWRDMISDLTEYGFLSKTLDPTKIIDMQFVTKAHGK